MPPDAQEIVAFYCQAKRALPEGRSLFVRADSGFASNGFFDALEAGKVRYTVKIRIDLDLQRTIGRVEYAWEYRAIA